MSAELTAKIPLNKGRDVLSHSELWIRANLSGKSRWVLGGFHGCPR